MNIHIDLLHPAHINLFKNVVNNYIEKHNFIITCINRGGVIKIAEKELNVPINVIGKHRGTKMSIIFEANFLRFFQLFFFLMKKKIDVGISFGSFLAGAILRLKGKPYIHLCDDPERKFNVFLENLTSTERYLPPIVLKKGKTKTFNALKEWAYLSPVYFHPNKFILKSYNLKPKNYIFLREISTGSLNYSGQNKNLISRIANKISVDLPILLSLEDKKKRDQYPFHWRILNEPVKDIHTLMYFSAVVISSGDSMAREGAMLGVPSIYCGFREMRANNLLIERKMLFKRDPDHVPELVADLLSGKINLPDQYEFRERLAKEWTDVVQFIVELLERF